MNAVQRACQRCGQPMLSVVEIAPFGAGPGLVAFMCTECGTTDSVHQARKWRDAGPNRVGERAPAMPS
jgi:hypothetical protein